MRELFEKILKKPEERKSIEVKEKIDEPKQIRKLTWLYKVATRARIFWSEVNPFSAVFMLTITSFLIVFIVGFILPGMGILKEMPYALPVIGGIIVFALGWEICNYFNRNMRDRICSLSLEDGNVFCDNHKIDAYDGGEVLYLVDSAGRPLLNKDEDSLLRYNKQKTIFIPKNVIESFGSILRRRAKAYPDCKLQTVSMKLIDESVMYIPKKVSESRLLKKLENIDANNHVASEIIDQLRENILNITKNIKGHEAEQMLSIIKTASQMQEEFMSTPSKLKQLLEEQYYKAQGGRYGYGSRPYSPYRSFGGYGNSPMPPWRDIMAGSESAKPINLHAEDEEGKDD